MRARRTLKNLSPILCRRFFCFSRNRVRVARFEGVAAGLNTDMGVSLGADVLGELPNCFLRDGGVFGESGHNRVRGVIEPKSDFCLRLAVLKAVR